MSVLYILLGIMSAILVLFYGFRNADQGEKRDAKLEELEQRIEQLEKQMQE